MFGKKQIALFLQNVQQLIQIYESNVIQPPLQFRDEPILPPPQFRDYAPISAPRTKKQSPVAVTRVQITEQRRALKGYTKSYELSFESTTDPLVQLQRTRSAIERKFHTILQQMKGF